MSDDLSDYVYGEPLFFSSAASTQTVVVVEARPLTPETLDHAAQLCREDFGRPDPINPWVERIWHEFQTQEEVEDCLRFLAERL